MSAVTVRPQGIVGKTKTGGVWLLQRRERCEYKPKSRRWR